MPHLLTRLNAQLSSSWSFHLLTDTNSDISYGLDVLGNTARFDCFGYRRKNSAFSDAMLIETNKDYFFRLETFGEI